MALIKTPQYRVILSIYMHTHTCRLYQSTVGGLRVSVQGCREGLDWE